MLTRSLCKFFHIMINGETCENAVVSGIVLAAFFASVGLFISGGILYNRDGMRGMTYELTSCYVWSSSAIPSACISRYSMYPCYIVKWSISYGKDSPTFPASIQDPHTYGSPSDANKKAAEYKVSTSNR